MGEHPEFPRNHVEIAARATSAVVKVDGHMLICTRARLEMDAESLPVLTVPLPVVEGLVIDLSDARTQFAGETRAALEAMGWTPPMSWLAHLEAHDQAAFADDLRDSADDPAALRKCLRDWRITAEALSDPARREVLTGTPDPDDFTEVQRPGEPHGH